MANDDDLNNQTLGQYTIKSLLGRGGMATVYLARQASMDRDVAIKVMTRELADDEEFVSRFENEAQVIARLQHPHILPVIDFGREGRNIYIVMRLVQGGSLDDRLEKSPLTLDQARRMLGQIASALTFAHEQGIVHRDLKPNNVLLDQRDNAYLTDFGIAKMLAGTTKLTATGNILGTPAYMAPEQWRGDPVDARTDTYSLGVMLYEMVLGRLPFTGDTPYTLMYKHFNDPPPPPRAFNPDMQPGIEAVILRALAKEPDARFQSADEMAESFDNAVRGLPPAQRQATVAGLDATVIGTGDMPVTPPPRATPPTMEEAATLPPQTPFIGTAVAPPRTAPAAAAPPTAVTTPARRGPNWLTIGAVLIVLLAIMGGGGYFLFGTADDGEKDSTPVGAAASPTPVPTERFTMVRVLSELVSIRRWPGFEYEEIGTLQKGTEAQVLGVTEDGRWYQVVFERRFGWVSAESVESFGKPDVEVVIWDRDNDRIADEEDACPDDAVHDEHNDPCNHDEDSDGTPDAEDVCPDDAVHDDYNDPCNHDEDGDGTPDAEDACPDDVGIADNDGCPPDEDADGVPDADDVCPDIPGAASFGGCPPDGDGDGIPNTDDPCPLDPAHDEIGNPCDPDEDNDGVLDADDACPLDPNDDYNDPCNHDEDDDGILDADDDCPDTAGDADHDGCPPPTIMNTLAGEARLTAFVAAIDAADVASTLQSEGPYTVFAPTDDAVQAFLDEFGITQEAMLADTELLTALLQYHIIPDERLTAAGLVARGTVDTPLGWPITITVTGDGMFLNDTARILVSDITVENGIIHVIDAVLWQPLMDADGDGVPDNDDVCPGVFGPADNDGCPWPDGDGDGVPDNDDVCPGVFGPADNHGCPWPDADGDGVPDNDDDCPSVIGPADNHGCPWGDTDGDGVPDNDDDCPGNSGPADNHGCPWGDADGDGFTDNVDACPQEAAPEAENGCPSGVTPDTDGDGVPDDVDTCPTTAGPADNGGCPHESTDLALYLPTEYERISLDSIGVTLDYPTTWIAPQNLGILHMLSSTADNNLDDVTEPAVVIMRGSPEDLLAFGMTSDISSPINALEHTVDADFTGVGQQVNAFRVPTYSIDVRVDQHLWIWLAVLSEDDWLYIIVFSPVNDYDIAFGEQTLNHMLTSLEYDGQRLSGGADAVQLSDVPLRLDTPILERFDDNQNDWQFATPANGQLVIEIAETDRLFSAFPNTVLEAGPVYYVQTTAEVTQQPSTFGYGIGFRVSTSGKDLYYFAIQNNQHYILYSLIGDNTTLLVPSTRSDVIHSEPGARNTLGLLVIGDYMELYINGQRVETLVDGALSSGNVHLAAHTLANTDGPLTVAFDDFVYLPLSATGNPHLADNAQVVIGTVLNDDTAITNALGDDRQTLATLASGQQIAVLGHTDDQRYLYVYAQGVIGWVENNQLRLSLAGEPVDLTPLPALPYSILGTPVQAWPVFWPDAGSGADRASGPVEATIEQGGTFEWTFTGRAGEVVTLGTSAVDAPNLDLYMKVYGPDGTIVAQDDDEGPDYHPLIRQLTLPADGTYTVEISSLDGVGPFTLTLEREN